MPRARAMVTEHRAAVERLAGLLPEFVGVLAGRELDGATVWTTGRSATRRRPAEAGHLDPDWSGL